MEMLSSAVGPGRRSWLDSVGKYCGAWATEKKGNETSVTLYLADSLGINLQTRDKKNLKELETIQIKMRSDNSTKPEHKN